MMLYLSNFLIVNLPSQNLPLPNPDTFFDNTIWNIAFPQILIWAGAVLGVLIFTQILRSFTGNR